MTSLLVGFDSAWTPTNEGAIVGILQHSDGAIQELGYVSRQLGHKDSAITLRVYARWLQDDSRRRGVDRLDETQPSASPAHLRGQLRSVKMLSVIGR